MLEAFDEMFDHMMTLKKLNQSDKFLDLLKSEVENEKKFSRSRLKINLEINGIGDAAFSLVDEIAENADELNDKR